MKRTMKLRRFAPFVYRALGICLLASLSACSLLHRQHNDSTTAGPAKTVHHATGRGLELELKVSPDPVKLGEVREITANITVRNTSKSPITLKFPTTQILEISLRDVATGTVVSKWSTDRSFTENSRLVPINRDEHLDYSEPITTRDLKAGKAYNLEVAFLGYESELSAKKVIIPQP